MSWKIQVAAKMSVALSRKAFDSGRMDKVVSAEQTSKSSNHPTLSASNMPRLPWD
jgi:hypothetical protein